MPKAPHKVVRHGRYMMERFERPANEDIVAGDLVNERDDGTLELADSLTQNDRLAIAIDDRMRGFELGDTYDGASGELVPYMVLTGGGVTVNMADGETLDVSAENRMVLSGTPGKIRPFSGDNAEDVLFQADEDSDIAASGSDEPVDCEVV